MKDNDGALPRREVLGKTVTDSSYNCSDILVLSTARLFGKQDYYPIRGPSFYDMDKQSVAKCTCSLRE